MALGLLNFPHTAYLVTLGDHELYDGLSAATLTLTGDLPSVPFRVAVTLLSSTGHTDCTGTVTVGTETLTFTGSGQTKKSTKTLTALPTITTNNIDCSILVVAITTNGDAIQEEVTTAKKVRFEPTTRTYMAPSGVYTQFVAYAMIRDETIKLHDTIRYLGTDYLVKRIEAFPWLDGKELYRILYF